jgi:hypothetical protein
VPPGSADGYEDEKFAGCGRVAFGPDESEDTRGSYTRGAGLVLPRSIRWPRAVDWRAIANATSAAAIKTEDRIAAVLADTQMGWHRDWESKPERRFAVRYYNHGETGPPRDDGGDPCGDYYGPIDQIDGKLVPRRYRNDGPAVTNDAVARIEATTGGDDRFFESQRTNL